MILKLALKNIRFKPWKAAATVIAIALAVAILFCMFSFNQSSYDYIYSVETADAGDYDIVIRSTSSSDRLTLTEPLKNIEGIEDVSPTLALYAIMGGEYVRLRGYEKEKVSALDNIEAIEGDISSLSERTNNVAVSKATAEHFGLSIGSQMRISLGSNEVKLFVSVIAKNSGYFLADAPYAVVGTSGGGIAGLIMSSAYSVYNEIYIKAQAGVLVDDLIERLSALPAYADMSVTLAKDAGYIEERANSIAAPVTISGIAVVVLAAISIIVMFASGYADKRAYAAKLKVAGATRQQLLWIFLAESAILAFAGALLGSLLAGGVLALLLKIALSSLASFSISFLKLFGAAAVGFLLSVAASLQPLLKVYSGSVRESETVRSESSLAGRIAAVSLLGVTIAGLVLEGVLEGAKGALSIVNVLLLLATAIVCSPYVMRFFASLTKKASSPAAKVGSVAMVRDRKASRSMQILTVTMTVSMLLFMAWSLTTSIFNDYKKDFANMVLVTNVRSDVDSEQFKSINGVTDAIPMVWRQGCVIVGDTSKTMNLLGSEKVLGLLDFKYITDRATVEGRLSGGGDYIFTDRALTELYGVKEGDVLALTIGDVTVPLIVGGVLENQFFSGNYIVVSEEVLSRLYGVEIDTVLVVATGDAKTVAADIRAAYAVEKNYYAVEALEAFRWESESVSAVFDLIGVLAVVLTVLAFVIITSNVIAGRSATERDRGALLAAGMSKKTLLGSEIFEHSMAALIAFAVSFGLSAVATFSLVGALRLFGLYFEFMYTAWIVAVVGISIAVGYSLLPIALGFKGRYNMRRS